MIKKQVFVGLTIVALIFTSLAIKIPAHASPEPHSETATTLSASLAYANYLDKEIANNSLRAIDVRYHNSDNPLALELSGTNFNPEEEYPISIEINRRRTDGGLDLEFSHEFPISGSELNDGVRVPLKDYSMSLMDKEHLPFDAMQYEISVSYQDQSFLFSYDYGYEETNHLINYAFLTDADNKELFSSQRTATPGFYLATAASSAYVHFQIYGLPDDERFTYEVQKSLSGNWDSGDAEIIATDTLSGQEILAGGIVTPVDATGYYRVSVSNNLGIIAWGEGFIETNLSLSNITKIGAQSGVANLKLDIDYFPFYTAKAGESINFKLYGANYDSDREYQVKLAPMICTSNIQAGACSREFSDKAVVQTFTGAELNSGTVLIEFPYYEEIDNALRSVNSRRSGEGPGRYEFISMDISVDDDSVLFGVFQPWINFKYIDGDFSANLLGDELFEETAEVYLSLDDYRYLSDLCNGIAGLIGDLEYDQDKLELVSVEALSNFELVSGDHYVLHNIDGVGVPAGTKVLKFVFRNKGLQTNESTTIGFTNIIGSDGANDIPTDNAHKTLTFSEITPAIEDTTYKIQDDIISGISTGTTADNYLSNFSLTSGASLIAKSADGTPLAPDQKIATGTITILLDKHDNAVQEYLVLIKGDINGDGEITITDLVKAKRHLAGLETYSGVYQMAGDITSTGAINITDVVKICRHIAGLGDIEQ